MRYSFVATKSFHDVLDYNTFIVWKDSVLTIVYVSKQ